jgi:hypothetical protein
MDRRSALSSCPHCQSKLEDGGGARRAERGDTGTGGKSTEQEIVSCPDCGRVIDGFSPH